MARRLDFTYRGNPEETHLGLVSYIERRSLLKAWVARVKREPTSKPWIALFVSYLCAYAAVAPAGVSWLAGAAVIHAIYIPLGILFWRMTCNTPRVSQDRARRLQLWLERVREALPPDASLDVHAGLQPPGCQGRNGQCGHPWMESYLFMPDGSTIEVRVTDGRACPLVRSAVSPGKMLVELDLAGEDPGVLSTMARQLSHFGDPQGVMTRLVEPDGPYRLRWVLEQELSVVGDGIPVWPVLRLIAMRSELIRASRGLLPAPQAEVQSLSASRRWAFGTGDEGLVPASASLPLRRVMASMQSPEHLWSMVPGPSMSLVSLGVVINGLLGVGALAFAEVVTGPVTSAALQVGAMGWSVLLGLSVFFGALTLAPIPAALWRRGVDLKGNRRVGTLDVVETGLKVLGGAPEAKPARLDVDFERPFTVHLTREAAPEEDCARVFMTILQRDGEGNLKRAGFTAVLKASDEVVSLPAKHEVGLPELDERGFVWLWGTLRKVSAAHGQTLPALGQPLTTL